MKYLKLLTRSGIIFHYFFFAIILFPCLLKSQGLSSNPEIQKEFGLIENIKSIKEFKILFTYDGMRVGRFESEEEYINYQVTEHETKEAGSGEKWLQGWKNSRQERYEPDFIKSLNKVFEKKDVKVAPESQSSYTLIVKTKYSEPGYNIGVSKFPAFCHFEFEFVDASNPGNVLLRLYVQDVEGSGGFDFDVGTRLTGSYSKAGKVLGKYLIPYF